jgi:hypothetical protein
MYITYVVSISYLGVKQTYITYIPYLGVKRTYVIYTIVVHNLRNEQRHLHTDNRK